MKRRYIVWALIAALLMTALVLPIGGTLATMIATDSESTQEIPVVVEEPKAEEPKPEEEPKEEPEDEPKAEEPVVTSEEPKAEEPKPEEPKAEEPVVTSEEPKPEEPEKEETPVESTEPVETTEPVESTEPTESVEPTESTEPVETTEPDESIEPTESIEPSETVEPTESTEPSETVEPTESAEPTESVEPTESIEPSETVEPAESTEPVESAKPVESTEPAVTEEPTAAPEVTAEPEAPAEPTEEPVVEVEELSVGLIANTNHVFVGEGGIYVSATISGGVAPYSVALKVENSGETVADYAAVSTDYSENGFTYEPQSWGTHVLTVKVEDAAGQSGRASVTVHVAEREAAYQGAWEKTMDGVELTGDWRADLIAIARTQLGYEESEKNFIIDDEGVSRGYTRYGEWFGAPYSEWCGMFVAFCANYANISRSAFPVDAHVGQWADKLAGAGALEKNDLDYVPAAGDLIFFDWEQDGAVDHMGVVEKVDGYSVYTIQGNAEGAVRRFEYSLGDNDIYAYGNTAELMEQAGLDVTDEPVIEEAEEEEELTVVGTAVTTKGGVNVRNKADGQYVVAQIAQSGTEVQVYGVETAGGYDWYHIKSGSTVGYIRADLLAMVEDEPEATAEPTAEPTETPAETEEPVETEIPVVSEEPTAEPEEEELNFGETPKPSDTPVPAESEEPVESVEPTAEPTQAPVEEEEEELNFGETPAPSVEPAETPAATEGEAEEDVITPGEATPEEDEETPAEEVITPSEATEGEADEDVTAEPTEEPAEPPTATEDEAAEEDVIVDTPAATEGEAQPETPAATDGEAAVATEGEAQPMTEKEIEIAAWIAETNPSEEMIARAERASSLEALMLEGDKLVYVRTGEAIATYNEETGELIDLEYNIVIGKLDLETGMILPLVEEDQPALPADEDEVLPEEEAEGDEDFAPGDEQ